MEVLNGTTLVDALVLCDNNPGIRVGIACASMQTANAFIDSIWNEVTSGRMPGWEIGRDIDGLGFATLRRRRVLRTRSPSEPSFIEIFTPFSEAEIDGKSFHRVLYESRLRDGLVQRLGWTERLPLPGEKEEESEELDEFLNSFKIVEG